MYGAISADLLFDYAKKIGMWFQQPLAGLETPEWYFIKPEYLCRIPDEIHYYSADGTPYSSRGDVDHPSFTRLREHLANKGLIHIERSWSNGDRVLKSFYLNNYLMLPGDRFPCAPAMVYPLTRKGNYNNGEIDPTVKNYRDDSENF